MLTSKKHSEIVLDLYRGAQSHHVTEFTSFAINTLKSVIGFDTAMFGLMSRPSEGKLVIHYGHLYNERHEALDEWRTIFDRDPIAGDALNNLGRGIHYHVPARLRATQDADILDYAIRRRHLNVLGLALPYGPNQITGGVSLRRADSRWGYNDQDKLVLEILMPHVCEAFRINRALFSQKIVLSNPEPVRGFCIFDNVGTIVFQDESFGYFARALFADFENFKIPRRLRDIFCVDRQSRMVVGSVLIRVTKSGHLNFLSIRPQNKFDVLTGREQAVAKFYGTGLTYKEIGVELSISPSTTRRHIEAIYLKLKIKTKADLAFLVHANAGSMSAEKLFVGIESLTQHAM